MLYRLGLVFIIITLLLAEPYVSEAIINAIEKKYGSQAKNRFTHLNATLEKLKDKSDFEKLAGVNNFYNNVPYKSDTKNWKKKITGQHL